MSEQIAREAKASIDSRSSEQEIIVNTLKAQVEELEAKATTISDVEEAMQDCQWRLSSIRDLSRNTGHYDDLEMAMLNDARRAIIVVERVTLELEVSRGNIAEARDKVEKAKSKLREIQGED